MVHKDAADPVHERSIPDFQTRHSAETLCVDFIREAAKIVCIPKVGILKRASNKRYILRRGEVSKSPLAVWRYVSDLSTSYTINIPSISKQPY